MLHRRYLSLRLSHNASKDPDMGHEVIAHLDWISLARTSAAALRYRSCHPRGQVLASSCFHYEVPHYFGEVMGDPGKPHLSQSLPIPRVSIGG